MTVSREQLAEEHPELLFCDGFDEALIGLCYRFGQEPVALYDRRKIIEILMSQGMDWDEAEDYFGFNVIGAWVGEHTPAFADLSTVQKRATVSPQEIIEQIDAYYRE